MTLTLSDGPLATKSPHTVNYRIDGPDHRLLFTEFPRRVRAMFGHQTALDSTRGMLLHETEHLPQLYVPREDIRAEMLEPSEHTTRCPFKGDAACWSLRAGDRVAENAVWEYHEPTDEARWLRGYLAVEFSAMDACYSLRVGDRRIQDAVWFYPEPLENALKAENHLCYSGEGVEIHVDGRSIE